MLHVIGTRTYIRTEWQRLMALDCATGGESYPFCSGTRILASNSPPERYAGIAPDDFHTPRGCVLPWQNLLNRSFHFVLPTIEHEDCLVILARHIRPREVGVIYDLSTFLYDRDDAGGASGSLFYVATSQSYQLPLLH